jgi:hypothetical protein
MEFIQPPHEVMEPSVALRPGPAALDPEAVSLSDDMEVGQVRHPPSPTL